MRASPGLVVAVIVVLVVDLGLLYALGFVVRELWRLRRWKVGP